MTCGAVTDEGPEASSVEPPDAHFVPDELLLARLDAVEAKRLSLKADEARLLAEVEHRKLYKSGGHASMYGLLRSRFGWSDGECKQALSISRGGVRFGWFLGALADGTMPVSHAEVALRAALQLDRAGYANVDADLGFHANEAQLEYDRFSKRIQTWQNVNDPARANRDGESQHARRHAKVTVTGAGCTVTASLDALDGAEFMEIFANFVDAEFISDWNAAAAIHGEHTGPGLLERTDRQRQADALMTIARTAADASPTIAGGSEPSVVIVVDERTFADAFAEFNWETGGESSAGLCADTCHCHTTNGDAPEFDAIKMIDEIDDPLLPSQRRCETSNGLAIDPRTAVLAALLGHVRWMMVDRLGDPLAVSSKQRLFRGPMRDAVMLISDRCICPGCRQRTGAAQADHLDEYHQGGPTALTNGAPICARHNRFKSRNNYRPRRDHRGQWHIYDHLGKPVT
jgi:hypothetical protein